mgnify:CR=1 FL=1|jgi:hypothetical protein
MGIAYSKSITYNDLHIITYNYNYNSDSQYNKTILNNFINKYNDTDNIICIQGIRNNSFIYDDIKKNKYFVEELGLLIITNLEIIKSQYIIFNSVNYEIFNKYKYGFQKIHLNYINTPFCIYNLELIPDEVNELSLNHIRETEIMELISFICNNIKKDKIHIITGCFYDMKDDINELINISKINNIITNLKTCEQESYIFIYSNNLLNNLDNLNEYILNKFNIQIISHKIYNLEIGEHCPFETILRLKEY